MWVFCCCCCKGPMVGSGGSIAAAVAAAAAAAGMYQPGSGPYMSHHHHHHANQVPPGLSLPPHGIHPHPNAMLWPGMKTKQRRGVLRRAVFSDNQRRGKLTICYLSFKNKFPEFLSFI